MHAWDTMPASAAVRSEEGRGLSYCAKTLPILVAESVGAAA